MTRTVRFRIALFASITTVLGLLACYVAVEVTSARSAVTRFRADTDEAKFLGKDAEEVVRALGAPYLDTRKEAQGDGDEFLFTYSGPYGETCRIEFRAGHVTRVEHYGK